MMACKFPIHSKCFMIDLFKSQSASTSGSAVFISCFAIFHDQTHNRYGAYLFRLLLAVQTALPEVCTD